MRPPSKLGILEQRDNGKEGKGRRASVFYFRNSRHHNPRAFGASPFPKKEFWDSLKN